MGRGIFKNHSCSTTVFFDFDLHQRKAILLPHVAIARRTTSIPSKTFRHMGSNIVGHRGLEEYVQAKPFHEILLLGFHDDTCIRINSDTTL